MLSGIINNKSIKKNIYDYFLITVNVIIMVVGVYFFKFPNKFAFGGLSGYAIMVEELTGISATQFTTFTNFILLIIGFIVLGKSFGLKTFYASILFTVILYLFEYMVPIEKPLTDQPVIELLLASFIPSITTAFLFNIGASSGGTDIIAMILKKYTGMNIAGLMLVVDVAAAVLAFFILDIQSAIFTFVGMMAKTFVIDGAIEKINLCKCFTIVCEDPEPICDYIIKELSRSATIYDARGAYAHKKKTVILVTVNRYQAVKLRSFIRMIEPDAFMMITNSSEIIGKGFQNV